MRLIGGWLLSAFATTPLLCAPATGSAVPVAVQPENQPGTQTGTETGTHQIGDQTDQLIRSLTRPAPASIAFTEVRLSPLLQEPLIVSGELGYSGPASLDRRVMHPYRELTTVRGESVRVEREGEPVRSFALKRAPELRGLLSGFSALLTGDTASLRRNFDISSRLESDDWAITMTPTDAKARRRIKQLSATGHDTEPRCFTLTIADGGSSVMLLGDASKQTIPTQATAEQLDALCNKPLQP